MKIPPRRPDWDRRLVLVTAQHMQTPMEWGVSDCVTRVADVVEALTGFDPASAVRGTYASAIGAQKILLGMGHENVEELLMSEFPGIGRLRAQRGDLVTVEDDGKIAAAYVTEYGVATPTERGTFFRPQTSPSIRKAFRVG